MEMIHFPRWAEVLSKSSLDERTAENYRVSIRWYLSWCRKCGLGCTVKSATDFVEWAHAEKNASEWMVERWKEGIRWFFVNAKVQGTADESEAPTPSALKLDEKLVSQIATSSASDAKQNYGNFGSEERIETYNMQVACESRS